MSQSLATTLHIRSSLLAIEHPRESLVRTVLFAVLAVCIIAYLYFVTASILNVMARNEALAQIKTIDSTIGSMESTYFALSEQMTVQEASHLGLTPVQNVAYVYRPGNAASAATISSHEI